MFLTQLIKYFYYWCILQNRLF